ncbi:MAG: hypothetical protein QXK66_05955 [Sulfolobales archaeon]
MTASYINLDLTLYASFSLPMFKKDGDCWIKVYGYGAGTSICVDGNLKCHGIACSSQFLDYVAGSWINKERYLEELEGLAREVVEGLIKEFYCLSISASPWDTFEILTAAFLSRNTDFHKNTVRWVKTFLRKLAGPKRVSSDQTVDQIAQAAVSVYREFKSYQLLQFMEVLDKLITVARMVPTASPSATRRNLLKVKYLGPKVADSFILHSGLDTSRAPVDIHYMRFLKRSGFLGNEYIQPRKSYCTTYDCFTCPASQKCVYAYTIRLFKNLNGFTQTAAYIMDKLQIRRCEDVDESKLKALLDAVTTNF